ncbi:hypothetical protein Goshw_000368 [Gossypium schwendimanii]|uniref:Uncharacterized protein n=1 Tax=Gossypium schwendimanii TaxID=34291 RepID=A0A7J9L0T6_GOSSC|nr:hypothetical protein [Gossypium schwendimanii]
MYYCRVVKPGIFAVGAILAIISLIAGIFYYVTLNSKVNASLPNQGGIVMAQPQFPQENPGFVHGYTYSNEHRNNSNYHCKYHNARGHRTEQCVHLKNAIETAIRRGANS